MFDFIIQAGEGSGFVYKDSEECWYFNGQGTFTQVVDPDYPAKTVRGIPYLDGGYYVMTPEGAIYGSDINNPASWSALNVIQALSEPDGGVCLARQLNLIVAFGDYSTEFFYNAANPVGSPLLPYSSTFLQVGCAAAGSVVNAENNLIFVAQGRQKGRSVQVLTGTTPQPISTPAINRILDEDSMEDVSGYFIKLAGHSFYILVLPTSQKTLVYDFDTQVWSYWTELVEGNSAIPAALEWKNKELIITTQGNHHFQDGDYGELRGFYPKVFNFGGVISYLSSSSFSMECPTDPGDVSLMGSIYGFVETNFKLSSYTKSGEFDLIQDSTTGAYYALSNGSYKDGDVPIKTSVQTHRFDGGLNDKKFISRIEVIGDKTDSKAYFRYTNDDYNTWSKFRPVHLENQRSLLNRLGQTRRKAFSMVHYDDTPLRLESLEVDVEFGAAVEKKQQGEQ